MLHPDGFVIIIYDVIWNFNDYIIIDILIALYVYDITNSKNQNIIKPK